MRRTHTSVDMVLHLGDGYKDMMDFKTKYENLTFVGVVGNCDSSEDETEKFLNVNSKKILMLHGHHSNHRVKQGYKTIVSYATQKNVDICLFGHTHCPIIFVENNIIFMNPGSLYLSESVARISYGVVKIDEKGIIESNIIGKTSEGFVSI